eukprot:scaffold24972_cov75-Cyclotella_meneghiniana.AAC.5
MAAIRVKLCSACAMCESGEGQQRAIDIRLSSMVSSRFYSCRCGSLIMWRSRSWRSFEDEMFGCARAVFWSGCCCNSGGGVQISANRNPWVFEDSCYS